MLCHFKRISGIKIIFGFISQTQPEPLGIFFIAFHVWISLHMLKKLRQCKKYIK